MSDFDMTVVSFVYHPDSITPSRVRIAVLPRAIQSRDDLFRNIAERMRLPAYFGANWDALEECLADLSWVEEDEIVLWHQDLPLTANPKELRIYLDVLNGVLRDPGTKKLTVSFPESAREKISRTIE